jgi:GNAT superfamily N-acetyltransferase
MPSLELRPFSDELLGAAGALLARRHRAHRAVEPLLPARYEDRAVAEAAVAALWREPGASGAAALRGGELAGYLVGRPADYGNRGLRWILVPLAGHAVAEPELVRDLYATAAERWVDEGLERHGAFVPACDRELADAWFRLTFGAQATLALRETEPAPPPPAPDGVAIRPSSPGDLDVTVGFDRLLYEYLQKAPSFSGLAVPDDAALAEEWRDTWQDERFVHFVAEREDRVVGHALLYTRPPELHIPERSIDLAHAATVPDVRGSGVGLALAAHVLGWARAQGYEAMTTDWRLTNLLASRFWPRRGFRPTFLRLYRALP